MYDDELLKSPEPDPSWDYYETWNALLEAKVEIDRALSLIKVEEVVQHKTDFQANRHVQNAISALQEIVLETDLYESED